MSTKDRRSHDQKRKAKLAKRAERQGANVDVSPYTGTKYQKDAWIPQLYETELAVYEAILASNKTLTNDQVRQAFIRLIRDLRSGEAGPLGEDLPKMAFVAGSEVDYLIWNIRRHWRMLFEDKGIVSTDDLVGILRTLLHSIQARAWHTGPSLGYVAFLREFMQGGLY